MNQYVTGAVIKELREKNKITQSQLAETLGVSDKAISKWETGKGYPDITLLEPIADVFHISIQIKWLRNITIQCKTDLMQCMCRSVFYFMLKIL